MTPFTAGARPGKINMMSLPNSANSRLLPERKPSPTPTSSSKDPTPQAMPNMVRNDRSLCAHRLRKICANMSKTVRIIERHCTFQHEQLPKTAITLTIQVNEFCGDVTSTTSRFSFRLVDNAGGVASRLERTNRNVEEWPPLLCGW